MFTQVNEMAELWVYTKANCVYVSLGTFIFESFFYQRLEQHTCCIVLVADVPIFEFAALLITKGTTNAVYAGDFNKFIYQFEC